MREGSAGERFFMTVKSSSCWVFITLKQAFAMWIPMRCL